MFVLSTVSVISYRVVDLARELSWIIIIIIIVVVVVDNGGGWTRHPPRSSIARFCTLFIKPTARIQNTANAVAGYKI
jgi:hypothetical protein